MLWQLPSLHCPQKAEMPPWRSKSVSVVVTGAFPGDRTAQFTFSCSTWRAHMFRAVIQNNTKFSFLVPMSFTEVLNKSFWKLHSKSTAFRSPVMVHEPFLSKPQQTKTFSRNHFIKSHSFLWELHMYMKGQSLFPFRRGSAVYSQQAIAESATEITYIL